MPYEDYGQYYKARRAATGRKTKKAEEPTMGGAAPSGSAKPTKRASEAASRLAREGAWRRGMDVGTTAPKARTFPNQRQPADTAAPTSPYGYPQAMGPTDDTYAPTGTRHGDLTMRRLAIEREEAEIAALKAQSRGRAGAAPRPTTVTTRTEYEGKRPELETPEYDRAKIKKYRAQIAGPAMARLRSELRRAMSASYENPNVRRHILRGALEGYGIGLGGIQAESERAAGARYAQEYGMEYKRAMDTYTAAMNAYLATGTQIQTTGYGTGTTRGPGQYVVGPWGVGGYIRR